MFHVKQSKDNLTDSTPLWAIRACIIGFWRAGVQMDTIAALYGIPVFRAEQYISEYQKTDKYKQSIIEQPVN